MKGIFFSMNLILMYFLISVSLQKDESDEEESTSYKPSMNIDPTTGEPDPNNPTLIEASKNKKKKRRWRRNDPRPRRWVLQEKEEFLDRIRKRRQRATGRGDDDDDEQQISDQYHGVVESNASKYVLLSVAPTLNTNNSTSSSPSSKVATEQISIQPIHGVHTFSQPYRFSSLTLEEAETAIEQQRNTVTRYMMHGKMASQSNSSEAKAALATGVAAVGGGTRGRGMGRIGPAPKAMSRARLLGKLGGGGGGDEDDADDVMRDVRFSSSKGGGGRARKELLSSMGDGVTADDDGVMGGANDSEFGGRRRFGRVATNKDDADTDGKKGKGGEGKTSTGFEAGAMEEGFYQRDVAAEYEALDYDANEQFDNDDVNVGEDEMMDDGGGYGGGDYDSNDDNLDSDDEGASDDEDAFKGMASASGLKAMLAKARGDSPVNVTTENAAALAAGGIEGLDVKNIPVGKGGKAIDKMLDAAKKTAEEMEKKKSSSAASTPEDKKSSAAAASAAKLEDIKKMGIEKDKDGKRLITLEAVRREIWLNSGAITSKRLTKKFDVTKKNPDRQALFKTIVMELCTIKKDADGNKLVLKQHYAKI